MRQTAASLALLSAVVGLAVSGTAAPTPATTLQADVAEWSIVPSTGAVRAGLVRVVVRNLGASPHQVTVVRTATFGARLRLVGAHAVVTQDVPAFAIVAGAPARVVRDRRQPA